MCLHIPFNSCSTKHTLVLPHLCCYVHAQAVTFSLNNTDMQCAYNRSGLLCGACKKGYSRVLATSYCKQCTSSHLALLIPFAVMGVFIAWLQSLQPSPAPHVITCTSRICARMVYCAKCLVSDVIAPVSGGTWCKKNGELQLDAHFSKESRSCVTYESGH